MIFFSDFRSGAGPGISFVGSGTFFDETASSYNFSSLVDSAGGTPTILADDLVVAIFSCGSSSDRPDATIQATGYTLGNTNLTSANGAIVANLQMSYKKMPSTPDTSFSYGVSGGTNPSRSCAVFVFRGVNTTTPLDVTSTIASGTGTGAADPPTITPSTAGAWIGVAGSYCHNGDRILYTNPGDLSSTTNHFRSALGTDTIRDGCVGAGIKTNWTSGAFDGSTLSGGSTSGTAAWCALAYALRPA